MLVEADRVIGLALGVGGIRDKRYAALEIIDAVARPGLDTEIGVAQSETGIGADHAAEAAGQGAGAAIDVGDPLAERFVGIGSDKHIGAGQRAGGLRRAALDAALLRHLDGAEQLHLVGFGNPVFGHQRPLFGGQAGGVGGADRKHEGGGRQS